MAPVYIFFFADLAELERVADARNYCELLERGALTASHGWTPEHIEGGVAPYLRSIVDEADRAPLRFRRSEDEVVPTVSRSLMSLRGRDRADIRPSRRRRPRPRGATDLVCAPSVLVS